MNVKDYLSKHQLPGEVLFAKVWGSRSHNTDIATSDWDYSGVYVAPTILFLGLNTQPDESYVSAKDAKPDFQFHEVGKFCRLLIEGNPTILEMLWTENLATWGNEWSELLCNRDSFLTKVAVRQYLGFAENQLKALVNKKPLHTTGGTYNEKWAYHLMRLLSDSERVLNREGPKVWKEGLERDFLMSIRSGEISAETLIDLATEKIAKQNAMYEKSDLPETGDTDLLNNWLIQLRYNQ